MTNKDSAVFTCGYCGNKTKIKNSIALRAVNGSAHPVSFCSCGKKSYASSIRLKIIMGDFKIFSGRHIQV